MTRMSTCFFSFFFFQAEDGIRDPLVTGVQTCALPISRIIASLVEAGYVSRESDPVDRRAWLATATEEGERLVSGVRSTRVQELNRRLDRSEERRVGKEGRFRWLAER